MFYPAESLKRGGRFYLCWVADSWPFRFDMLTHKQLWSQDVRTICDDLIVVMSNESGRPVKRFSLRLSSQLMRGLTRLYQKKVNVFLSELCMITAKLTKSANKKYYNPEIDVQSVSRPRVQEMVPFPQIVLPEEPENEQHIEEIIQKSINVVANIDDITLKEATLPEFQLPPNDNFGEESVEQVLQLLGVGLDRTTGLDRTVEVMRDGEGAAAQLSVLGAGAGAAGDMSHDRTRADRDLQMEALPEHDATAMVFRKSNGEELISGFEFEKDIPIPEIPDIVIPIPPLEQLPEPEERPIETAKSDPARQDLEEIELEELEETEPQAKRRRLRTVIIDKKKILSTDFLRARIENPNVDLRCENVSDDIVNIRVPCDVLFRRPSHAGAKLHSNIALDITRLFLSKLGFHRSASAEKQFQEQMMYSPKRARRAPALERIAELDEPAPAAAAPTAHAALMNITRDNLSQLYITVQGAQTSRQVEGENEMDISEMLTQKVDTVTERTRKRKHTVETVLTPKKLSVGIVSFKKSQENQRRDRAGAKPIESEILLDQQADKENIPENMQYAEPTQKADKSIAVMLQEAGLADILATNPEDGPIETVQTELAQTQPRNSRRLGSNDTETPLGSLDRTKVSLGDSEQTTDSNKFIRSHWGTEGTMLKIITYIKEESSPLTVWSLMAKGPTVPDKERLIAARCFSSILKLKQHGFINVKKNQETLEIEDITFGPRFDTC